MAITKLDETPKVPPAAAPTPQAKHFNQSTGQTPGPARTDKGTIGSLRNSPVSRSGISEMAHQFATRLRKRIEEFQGQDRDMYTVQLLDNKTSRTHYSLVLITKAAQKGSEVYAATYGYLIESSASKLPPRNFNWQNQQYSLQTCPSDAVDGDLISRINEHLTTNFLPTDAKISVVQVQVLPNEFVLNDDSTQVIERFLFNATQALSTELVKGGVVQEQPASAKLIANGGQPIVGRDNDPPPLFDSVGLPIRSDFAISLRQSTETNQNVWRPNDVAQPDLTRLEGYMDLDYRDPRLGQQGFVNGYPDPNAHLKIYTPRFVITRLDVLTEIITPELVLLALSTAAFVGLNNMWLEAFRPRKSNDDINLRDITAIGLETPLTGQLERLPAPGLSDLPKFYQMLLLGMTSDIRFSLDIDEAGDQTWLLSDFYRASHGDAGGVQNIIAAANRLTNGIFGTRWSTNNRIAIDENNRIALGYWNDDAGQKRDLRELDYVAMLNLTADRDITRLHDWNATFNAQTGEPLEVRLERRERIARELIASYTLKGWARRIVLAPEFIITLANSIAEAGLVPNQTNHFNFSDLTGQTLRSNPALAGTEVNFNAAGLSYFTSNRIGGTNFNGMGNATFGQAAPFFGFGQ